jgi:hypothetical protein
MKKRNPQNKIQKSKAELHADLMEQISHLGMFSKEFDIGKSSIAKPISVILNLLLYGDSGNSLALLHHLGLRDRRFFDSAPIIDTRSSFAHCQLAGILVSSKPVSTRYLPLLSSLPHAMKKTPFSEWWMRPVVKDIKGRCFSRMELVKEVRDTDGGGHLDPGLGEPYADFKSGKYMGWWLKTGTGFYRVQHPHLACIRQIAHETLLTLQDAVPQAFDANPYVYPVDPVKDLSGVFLFGSEVKGQPGTIVPLIKVGEAELVGEL